MAKLKGFDILDPSSMKDIVRAFLNQAHTQSYDYGYVAVSSGTKATDPGKTNDFFANNEHNLLLGAAHLFDHQRDGKAQAIAFIRELVRTESRASLPGAKRILEGFRLRPALVLRDIAITSPSAPEPTDQEIIFRIEKWLQVIEDGLGAVRDRPIIMLSPGYASTHHIFTSKTILDHAIWIADAEHDSKGNPVVPPEWKDAKLRVEMRQLSKSSFIGQTSAGLDDALSLGKIPRLKIVPVTSTGFSYAAGLATGSAVWYAVNEYKGSRTSSSYYLPRGRA